MKKINLYKKSITVLGLALGLYTQASAIVGVHDEGLYTRQGNTFTIANNRPYTDIHWVFTYYDNSIGNWHADTLQQNSITINRDGYLDLSAFSSDTVFSKYTTVRYLSSDLGTSISKPLTDTILVKADGLELSTYSQAPDSLSWGIKYDNGDSVNLKTDKVTMTSNAWVSAYAKLDGVWYKQRFYYSGIFQNVTTGALEVPVLQSATYAWYFNNVQIPVYTSTYTPTELGTYTVVISSGNANLRTEGNTEIARFTFKVESLPTVTGIETSLSTSEMFALYPNPSDGRVRFANNNGTLEYKIEELNATEVASGFAFGNSEIDLSHLKSGVYLMHIKTEHSQLVKKMVIK